MNDQFRPSPNLTPPQLAKQWGVATEKVYAFIRSGELRAIDLATKRGGRPRYSIAPEDVAAFEKARQVVQRTERPAPSQRPRRPNARNYF